MAFPADLRADLYGAFRDTFRNTAHYLRPGNIEAAIQTQEELDMPDAVRALQELKPYRTALYALFAVRVASTVGIYCSSEGSALRRCSNVIGIASLVGYVPALTLFGMKMDEAIDEINR